MVVRHIADEEVLEVLGACCVIENYPDDKYGPSCLTCGETAAGRLLHVQCTRPLAGSAKVITVYEPDPRRWADRGTRRL